MAIKTNGAEGGTNGVVLTQGSGGNTGGASGDYWDAVQGSVTFSNAVSMLGSMSMLAPASSVATYTRWNVGLSLTKFKMKFLLCYPTLQSADHWVFAAGVGGTKVITLNTTPGNFPRLYTAAGTGTTIHTFASTFVAGRVYRWEVFMDGLSASTATVKTALFSGATVQSALASTTPDEEYDGTGISNTGLTALDTFTWGKYNSATLANAHHWDGVALDTDPPADYRWPYYTRPIRTPLPSVAVARAANY